MNINYKTAFLAAVLALGLSWILFLCFVAYALTLYRDTLQVNMIGSNNCAAGEYCANNPENMPASEETNNTTPGSKVSADSLYQNIDYRVRFDLKEDEIGVACSGTDSVNLVVVKKALYTNPEDVCATDAPITKSILATTVYSSIAFNQHLYDTYDYKSTPYTVGNLKGTRYTGTMLPEVNSILPEKLDMVVVENNGISYQIDSSFYDRNVYIW